MVVFSVCHAYNSLTFYKHYSCISQSKLVSLSLLHLSLLVILPEEICSVNRDRDTATEETSATSWFGEPQTTPPSLSDQYDLSAESSDKSTESAAMHFPTVSV